MVSKGDEPVINQDQEHNIKLVFVGDTAVGKTSVIMTWTQERFPTLYEPTVFDTYNGTKNYGGAEVQLSIWDTAGHDDLGRLRPIAFANTDCFLICFSLMDKNSLQRAVTKWIAEVKSTAKSCPCVLVGTKLDLREEREKQARESNGNQAAIDRIMADCVSTEQAQKEARDARFQGYVECSAKERKGLNNVFHTAFKVVFQLRQLTENAPLKAGNEDTGVIEGNNLKKDKDGCCGGKSKK